MAKLPLLKVESLNVSYDSSNIGPNTGSNTGSNIGSNTGPGTGSTFALRDISFSMDREKLAVVGESGSGKSTLGKAIIGLLDPNAHIWASRLAFDGVDLLSPAAPWASLRGSRIGLVFQDARAALDPVMTVGAQMLETLRFHEPRCRRAALPRLHQALGAVEIPDSTRILNAYPHELSGGLCQRVMIAMALLPGPDLLIADEPTSALDVCIRQGIVDLLDHLVESRNMGLIFISHDLNLVASFCDKVLVLYDGHLLETLPAADLEKARHPYTRGLLACRPQMALPGADIPLLTRDPAWTKGAVK